MSSVRNLKTIPIYSEWNLPVLYRYFWSSVMIVRHAKSSRPDFFFELHELCAEFCFYISFALASDRVVINWVEKAHDQFVEPSMFRRWCYCYWCCYSECGWCLFWLCPPNVVKNNCQLAICKKIMKRKVMLWTDWVWVPLYGISHHIIGNTTI